jgi:hypothetical protein
MPVENEWYIEGRIAITRLIGDLTAEELKRSAENGTQMIERDGVMPVYSIVDMSRIGRFPMKVSDVFSISGQGNSPKLKWIIVHSIPNRLISFLAGTFTHALRLNFRVVDNFEDALEMIRRVDPRALGKGPHPGAGD